MDLRRVPEGSLESLWGAFWVVLGIVWSSFGGLWGSFGGLFQSPGALLGLFFASWEPPGSIFFNWTEFRVLTTRGELSLSSGKHVYMIWGTWAIWNDMVMLKHALKLCLISGGGAEPSARRAEGEAWRLWNTSGNWFACFEALGSQTQSVICLTPLFISPLHMLGILSKLQNHNGTLEHA